MSAPRTNIKKQRRRHWGPLLGIAIAITVATLLFIWMVGRVADTDTPERVPQPAVEQTEGGIPATGGAVGPLTPDTTDAEVIEHVPRPTGD
jgi:hypothetical protein